MVRKNKAKTTAREKQMRREMILGKRNAMGNGFIQRPPASLFGDEEEKEEEEENEDEDLDEDEEDGEEEEDNEGKKGWSD